LRQELSEMQRGSVILALGSIAHKAVLQANELRQSRYPFAHAAEYTLESGLILLDSYHCSRYNTQTRRLTPEMFAQVFRQARSALSAGDPEDNSRDGV